MNLPSLFCRQCGRQAQPTSSAPTTGSVFQHRLGLPATQRKDNVRKTNTCSLTTKNIIEGINIIAMLLLQSRRTSLGCHCEKSCCIANTIQIQTHNAFRSLASCVRSRSSQALNIGGLFTRYFGTSRVDFKSRDFPAATGAQGRAAGPCGAAQRSAHTRSKWAGQD